MSICDLLGIRPGLTALIGGGGKTTLMYQLAEELQERGSVVACTSTRIRIPRHLPVLDPADAACLREALNQCRTLCVGSPAEEGKLSAPRISFAELASAADFVLVEADGARGLPAKAHASWEPVIPPETNLTVFVIGADCFDKAVKEICHRPELFAQRAQCLPEQPVTPETLAAVLLSEGCGDIFYVNKTENEEDLRRACTLAKLLPAPVLAGSLHSGVYYTIDRRGNPCLC